MNKNIVILKYDKNKGPILNYNYLNNKIVTGIDIIDNDKIIRNLNYILYTFNAGFDLYSINGNKIEFDYEKQENNIEFLIEKFNKLKDRLNEINNEKFYICDLISPYYFKVKYIKDNKINNKKIIFLYYDINLYPLEYNKKFKQIKTRVKIVDNDKIVNILSEEIYKLNQEIFLFRENSNTYYKNEDKEKEYKKRLDFLYTQLKKRLEYLNNKSYLIIDLYKEKINFNK